MRIVEKSKQRIAVLSLVGDPLGEPDAVLLRKKIQGVVDEKIKHVILDLGGVKHINSAGLGGLIAALVTMLRSGGDCSFASVGVHVGQAFKITNLSSVFTTYPSVDEALKNYEM